MNNNIVFLNNNNNSCYIDSFFIILYTLFDDDYLKKFLFKDSLSRIASTIRNEILNKNIKNIRNLISQFKKDNTWLYEQKEPLDVILVLKELFNLPKSCTIKEYTYQKTSTDLELIKVSMTRNDFACKFINSNIDIRLSSIDIDKSNNITKVHKITAYSMISFHINRNIGNKKSKHLIIPEKILHGHLTAIIVHLGNSFDYGHYVTYININNEWRLYDDLKTSYVIINELPNSIFRNCTDLIYVN